MTLDDLSYHDWPGNLFFFPLVLWSVFLSFTTHNLFFYSGSLLACHLSRLSTLHHVRYLVPSRVFLLSPPSFLCFIVRVTFFCKTSSCTNIIYWFLFKAAY